MTKHAEGGLRSRDQADCSYLVRLRLPKHAGVIGNLKWGGSERQILESLQGGGGFQAEVGRHGLVQKSVPIGLSAQELGNRRHWRARVEVLAVHHDYILSWVWATSL